MSCAGIIVPPNLSRSGTHGTVEPRRERGLYAAVKGPRTHRAAQQQPFPVAVVRRQYQYAASGSDASFGNQFGILEAHAFCEFCLVHAGYVRDFGRDLPKVACKSHAQFARRRAGSRSGRQRSRCRSISLRRQPTTDTHAVHTPLSRRKARTAARAQGCVSPRGAYWCRRRDSNPRPIAYEAIALPAELLRHGGARSIRIRPLRWKAQALRRTRITTSTLSISVPGGSDGSCGEHQLVRADIDHFTGVHVLEVMVRRHAGVVDASIGIQVNLPDQPVLHEQFQRVVHGRLGDPSRCLAHGGKQLLRRQVRRRSEQYFSHPDPLLRGPDAVLLEKGADVDMPGSPTDGRK